MKKALVVIVLLLGITAIFAQNQVDKGLLQVNAGVGISGWGIPIYVGADAGILKNLTVGGELSYRGYSYWGYNHSIIGILANGNYHFSDLLTKYVTPIPSEIDLYWGLNLGGYIWISESGYTGTGSRLGIGSQLGARYYFNDKLAANLEFGGGNTFGTKLGITYKLK